VIVTVAAYKGGVGKTTTAIHIAAFLEKQDPGGALLIDGDPNRSATGWSRRGDLPFRVVDERQAARYSRDYRHIVIDTAARPSREDLEALIEGCDLLIVPTTPDALALDALQASVATLGELGTSRYKILLTMVPPRPSRDGEEARLMLCDAGLPLFASSIRRAVAFQKAALAGCVVNAVQDARAAAAWSDYEAVGQELQR
jgi:chromosome partitioning protein